MLRFTDNEVRLAVHQSNYDNITSFSKTEGSADQPRTRDPSEVIEISSLHQRHWGRF